LAQHQNKRLRRQRYERQLEKDIQQSEDPSDGQFCVFNKTTKEKHKGLSLKRAQALWNSLENAIILWDGDVKK
jgi:hypothetical protein